MTQVGYSYGNFGHRPEGVRPSRNAKGAETERKLAALFEAGMTRREVAKAAGVSYPTAAIYARGLGVPEQTRGRPAGSFAQDIATVARANDIVERILKGETYESIASSYGITRERVRQIAAKQGVKSSAHARACKRAERQAEERAGNEARRAAKRAERAALVEQIGQMVANGMSRRQACMALGLSAMFGWDYARDAKSGKHGRWNRADIAAMRTALPDRRAAGRTIEEIAAEFGVSTRLVVSVLKELGLSRARSKGDEREMKA